MGKLIERSVVPLLIKRLAERRPRLQIVTGPRQVGKTTALEQVRRRWKGPSLYFSADGQTPASAAWIHAQWAGARFEASRKKKRVLLVLDEIQKINDWADAIKALEDGGRKERYPVVPVILGSSSLHIQKGAQESLAGRFELVFCPHWSWAECKAAFAWTLDQWLYFGGYPGAASYIRDNDRWRHYVTSSLIETVLGRDVLQLATIAKPALLRQLFMLAAQTPARILSFNKMLGQMQDAGNTVTLSHYLQTLGDAFLVSGLQNFSESAIRRRASSPKLIVWNNALMTALSTFSLHDIKGPGEERGWWVENAVGAALLNELAAPLYTIYYWRERDYEVDFIIRRGSSLWAIEVKSGRRSRSSKRGLDVFMSRHPQAVPLIIGEAGIPLETFFFGPRLFF